MIAAQILSDKETQKNLVGLTLGLAQSAPLIAFSAIAALGLAWNLEHLAVGKDPNGKWRFVRLSTQDTSNIADKNLTPFLPPIQSTAIRLTDAGSDLAEVSAALAAKQIETVGQKGLIQTGLEFLFGA